jgi:hypothetical protein
MMTFHKSEEEREAEDHWDGMMQDMNAEDATMTRRG